MVIHVIKTTTIMVKSETKELLDRAKKLLRKKSYDEVINDALKSILGIPDSLFGVDREKISEFKERDRLFSDEE